MSNDTTVALLGVEFPVDESEIEALEERSHPKIKAAKLSGLQYYWGDFSYGEEKFVLLIGKVLSKLGHENELYSSFPTDELTATADVVRKKLAESGIGGEPRLIIRVHPDV